MSSNKATIAAILELVGGYLGLLGLGWMFGGDLLKGILILFGYMIVLGIGSFLVWITFGLLGIIFVPLYIIVPVISAFKVHQFVTSRWR
jgi:hypothetical protein